MSLSDPPTTTASLTGKTVQELQSIAQEARITPQPARQTLSRAAQLSLIDQLSRWGGSGLALFAGVAIFITVTMARQSPTRGLIWTVLIFASLYACRRFRREFRRGDRIAARPFRWRANYTAALSVVSAAFGAGAVLLSPGIANSADAIEILALTGLAAAGASALHAFHAPAAAAAGAPAFAMIAYAAFRDFGVSPLSVGTIITGILAAFAIAVAASYFRTAAARRFPRTGFVRREVERVERPASLAGTSSKPVAKAI